jgi:small multidrug resistance pump
MIAIVAEVVGTSALKSSQGFTQLMPSIIVVIAYALAFYCLSLVLKTLPIGIAYAIWSGAGILLIALVGWVMFEQTLDAPAMIGMGFIITGIVIMNVFSSSVSYG